MDPVISAPLCAVRTCSDAHTAVPVYCTRLSGDRYVVMTTMLLFTYHRTVNCVCARVWCWSSVGVCACLLANYSGVCVSVRNYNTYARIHPSRRILRSLSLSVCAHTSPCALLCAHVCLSVVPLRSNVTQLCKHVTL